MNPHQPTRPRPLLLPHPTSHQQRGDKQAKKGEAGETHRPCVLEQEHRWRRRRLASSTPSPRSRRTLELFSPLFSLLPVLDLDDVETFFMVVEEKELKRRREGGLAAGRFGGLGWGPGAIYIAPPSGVPLGYGPESVRVFLNNYAQKNK